MWRTLPTPALTWSIPGRRRAARSGDRGTAAAVAAWPRHAQFYALVGAAGAAWPRPWRHIPRHDPPSHPAAVPSRRPAWSSRFVVVSRAPADDPGVSHRLHHQDAKAPGNWPGGLMVGHLVVGGLADRPWRLGGCLAVLPVRRDGRRSRHDSAAPTSDRAHRLSAASERCGTRPARTSCTRAARLAGRRPVPMTEAAPAGARNNAMHPGGDMASGLRGRSSWAMGRASGPGRGVAGKRGSLAKTPCTCTVGRVVHRQIPPDRQIPPANPTGKSHWRGPGRRWARPAAPVEMAEINAEAAQRPHTPRARRTPGARSSARQGRGRRQPLEVLPGWPPRPRDPRRHPLQRETGACRAPVRREAWVSAVDGGRGWFWLGAPGGWGIPVRTPYT